MRPHLLAVLVCGAALGTLSLGIAHHDPQGAVGGASIGGDLALLGTGSALLAGGLIAWARRPTSRFGSLLAAAGFAWFLVEFNNPGVGSTVLFTIGLATYAACPAVVAHAAFAYPSGILPRGFARAWIALAYGSTILLLGLGPALLADPLTQGCFQCPRDFLAFTSLPGLAVLISRVGLILGLLWTLGLTGLALYRVTRASPAARLVIAPVLLSAVAYLALVAADYVHGFGRGGLSTDDLDGELWLGESAALVVLVLGVAVAWMREARARSAVSHLVVQLGKTPDPNGLRDTLASTLADPALQLAYPLDSGRLVDASGRTMELGRTAGRAVTPLLRGGRSVAVLGHRADLLDDGGLLEEVSSAARLALERERLHAEVRTQVEELRVSRARVVQTADAERKRLERNLHDGAQQRLVVLSLALRLLRAQLTGTAAARVDAADSELRHALAELRELARGIYPAVLTDEGLAPAIHALTEGSTVPITIEALPVERLVPEVEAAAYFLVAELSNEASCPR